MPIFKPFINGNSGGVMFPSEQKAHEFDMGLHLQTGLPMDVFMSLISKTYPKSKDVCGIYYPSYQT